MQVPHVYTILTSCLLVSHPICASNEADSVSPVVTGFTKLLEACLSLLRLSVQDMCTRAGCIVQVREEDLTLLVVEAATFMEKERARASKRARRHRDPRTRSVAVCTHVLLRHIPMILYFQYTYSLSIESINIVMTSVCVLKFGGSIEISHAECMAPVCMLCLQAGHLKVCFFG